MQNPSNALASLVRQTGLEKFADAITIDQTRRCDAGTVDRCHELAANTARQQMLADAAAIGFALFAAAAVGRIGVSFVSVFGMALKHHRARKLTRASVKAALQGAVSDV